MNTKDEINKEETNLNSLAYQLKQREAELSLLNSIQDAINKEIGMQGVYDMVGDNIRNLFDAQVVGIYTIDHDKQMEIFNFLYEDGELIRPKPRKLDAVRKLLIDGKKLILIDQNLPTKVAEIAGKPAQAVPGTRLPKSILLVPMMVRNTVFGYVSIQNLDRELAFSPTDIKLLESIANSMVNGLENARLFNEAEQRNAELAVINSVQEGLVAEMDMQGIYDLVGDKIRDLFDAQVVAISTFDQKDKLEEFNYVFEDGERFNINSRPIDILRQKIIDSKEFIYLNENVDAMWTKITGEVPTVIPGTQFTKSALYVPMIMGKEVRGYVSLQNVESENAFSEPDIRLLNTLANSMTVALENARLFNETTRLLEETKQRATELQTVNKISHALVAQLDLKSLIKLIGDQMLQTFNADVVYLALHDKKANMLHFPYMYGEDDAKSREFGNGITEKIIINNEPLLINKDMEKAYEEIDADKKGKWVQSYLGVPIVTGNTATGVISVQSTEKENRFNEYDLRLLKTIAANVGVAIQNAEAYEKLQIALNDLKSAQEQLIQVEKMASLGELTAGIAHEIQNPLNFVNNFSEVSNELIDEMNEELDKGDLEEAKCIATDIKQNLKKINHHGKRAEGIVKGMLQHSRKSTVEKEPTDINKLADEYLRLAYHGLRAKDKSFNAELVTDFDEGIGKVNSIPQDMGRVILNLITNAFYAVNEKKQKDVNFNPIVSVSTKKNDDHITIHVSDNGNGIPEKVKEKIFQPFFTTKPTGEGTGLGLSMSYDIVTKGHGGKLMVETTENKGTTFIIELPNATNN
ncbi:GAF domain-containing protein [Maribacter polysiphoniae]|uniref:GAF domain-containing protein n=1 Tax=Maribacter polysiphoniae TaxID=429344 RepID=UPI002357D3ED|nr:GAF domain-containing protein [Maribacter polysiphoniae]